MLNVHQTAFRDSTWPNSNCSRMLRPSISDRTFFVWVLKTLLNHPTLRNALLIFFHRRFQINLISPILHCEFCPRFDKWLLVNCETVL